ncbi:MAG: HEPN domain-containing protein [Planctomycetota bacterium]|jgi:predicted nucleotidyltransferase/HEPN domain-containing protein
MKKSLAHLPKQKQDELEIIRDIILEKVPDVRMIVLFGSYARNEWVEDTHLEGHVTHVYESDFDILVATRYKKTAEDLKIHDIVKQLINATGKVDTPYDIIYHNYNYVNKMITDGQYFFTDIQKEGIYLYRKHRHNIGTIKTIPPEKRKQIAQQEFKKWFNSAKDFYGQYEHAFGKCKYKLAAFELHQATERFYGAVTLVFVNYRFRTHDIETLGKKAVSYDSEFANVFPCETDEQRKLFNLLKKAYVDARYKPSYRITKKQLEYLAKCVKLLHRLTKKICVAKIESFI